MISLQATASSPAIRDPSAAAETDARGGPRELYTCATRVCPARHPPAVIARAHGGERMVECISMREYVPLCTNRVDARGVERGRERHAAHDAIVRRARAASRMSRPRLPGSLYLARPPSVVALSPPAAGSAQPVRASGGERETRRGLRETLSRGGRAFSRGGRRAT